MTENAPSRRPDGHPAAAHGRVGVLLVNLGTPDAPTTHAVRRFLAEFLSDPRVVNLPRALWLPVLYGVILNLRPARSAKAYEKIWTAEGSPLLRHTRAAAQKLGIRMEDRAIVEFAMRYGSPSVRERIAALMKAGADRILVLPMYPQYSQTTSASVADATFDALKGYNWQPALRIAPPYHDDPAYIEALQSVAVSFLATLDWAPERVIISLHGAPKRHLAQGDPYYCHCAKTARLIRKAMGWSEEFAPLAFQSKFGREEWLSPATDETIRALASAGVKRIAVMTPGFTVDCLETLEEIAIVARQAFLSRGGENFAAIPCLNASGPMIDLLERIAVRETAGWL
ncbi:MAG: ferrochelatase [Parvularculaceae bacterium]|nr:ferrochelatase [Parvularculaceae bacterium]